MSPWERSIEIVVCTLVSVPCGEVGIAMIAIGGFMFAFDGNKLAVLGWLWPDRKLSLSVIGFGTALSAARLCFWLVRG